MNPEIVSFQYATGMCLLENVGGSEQNRSVANVQSDDLWPSRLHAVTHILQEKTQCMSRVTVTFVHELFMYRKHYSAIFT